jgi:ubiquinone/menaquinone biosynthesis C-methylase UbiE
MAYQFQVPELNAHYEGVYPPAMRQWRKLGAIDKAQNIRDIMEPELVSNMRVLEAGCGTGDVIAQLAAGALGGEFVGVDVIDPALNNAAVREAGNLSFVHQEGARLPFADGSFDLVFASHVLEHVEDERGFLSELKRVSSRYVYVEVPCELHLRTRYASLQRTLRIGHINSYTPESFSLTLQSSGLKVVRLKCFDHSLAVHGFRSSQLRAAAKKAVRGSLLKLSESLASKLFTYHCGALCTR